MLSKKWSHHHRTALLRCIPLSFPLSAQEASHAQHMSAQVVATGGLSFPKLGTTGGGLRLLEEGGHTLVPPYPALTPLIGPHPGNASLAGEQAVHINSHICLNFFSLQGIYGLHASAAP